MIIPISFLFLGVYMESHRHSRYIYLSSGSLIKSVSSALKTYDEIDIGENYDSVSVSVMGKSNIRHILVIITTPRKSRATRK